MDAAPVRDATGAPARWGLLIGDVAASGALAMTLLGDAEPWLVRRVTAPTTRLALKQAFDAMPAHADAAVVWIGLPTVEVDGAHVVVVADAPERYPDESTVALSWFAQRIAAAGVRRVVVAVAGQAAQTEFVATSLPAALIAVAPDGRALAEALTAGLAGAATDPTTGTVTLACLAAYLARAVPGVTVRGGDDRGDLVRPAAFELASRRLGPLVVPAEVRVGTVLPGRFRLEAELARGTFGTVFRARQLAVDRDVAVKLLHAEIEPGSSDGQLFLHEIRAVGRVDHPNVVRIYQADVAHDGRLFFAMELLAGPTLAEVAAAGPVPLVRSVALVTQVLSGLAAAHDAGLVHADVKPANVIVVAGDRERAVLVDFGLARLHSPEPALSAGGTPAFMAPEQLRDGRVDARSDLFAAALVLVFLATGWRRRKASELVPPLDGIDDARVRAALDRALAVDPRQRWSTARDFAAALVGDAAEHPVTPERLPFLGLMSFTESDHERLRGRDRDLDALVDHALFRSLVVVTAPSGVGKTSLLRAGLVPRLARLKATAIYVSGRGRPVADVIAALAPDATDLASALATSSRRVVVIVDQVETLLTSDGEAELAPILSIDRSTSGVAVVLAVREDYLARLLARRELAASAPAMVRLGPIDLDGARAAIVDPLAERRIGVTPDLLKALLDDLRAAAAALAPELGWGDAPAVYPPHLQLVGSMLYQTLEPDEASLTLEHYRRLGGFDAIVGEHLDRVLETEFDRAGAALAREVFLVLVTSAQGRAIRTEAELAVIGDDVLAVLETLRRQGLVVRTQRAVGEPVWELVHDSLVPRVLAWIDRHDLSRRRAMEQVRYHLRRSRGGALSLLSRRELRELDAHPGALADLERDHRARSGDDLGPSELVSTSRRIVRRTTVAAVAIAATVIGVVGYGSYDRYASAQAAARERSIRDRDLGRFTLELRPFDWIPPGVNPWLPGGAAVDVPITELPDLRWMIHDPDLEDIGARGAARPAHRLKVARGSEANRFTVRTSGGPAFLRIEGRHRAREPGCADSVLPLQSLPGYLRRGASPTLVIRVPSCRASTVGMMRVPGGPFMSGGAGVPVSTAQVAYEQRDAYERVLPAFAIDRTEVTNSAFAVFASMSEITGIAAPIYPDVDQLVRAGDSDYPAVGINVFDADAYCRFLGKRLPSSAEWQKALRGGLTLPDGRPNPWPTRNTPWPADSPVPRRDFNDDEKGAPSRVGQYPADVSPYGVVDLGGNASEWTSSRDARGLAYVRGANWQESTTSTAHEFGAIENGRPARLVTYYLGARCAASAE